MQATEILKSEHRVIEQVITCLERLADRGVADGRLDVAAAQQALDFFQNFADGCHHGKEEVHLFPLMEAHGFSPERGPTAQMRYEHDLGRQCVRAMAAAVAAAEAGQPGAAWQFADHARTYAALLREHIRKEDHCLFRLANEALTAEEQQALLRSFAHVEQHKMGAGTHEKYLRIADELANRFDVPHADVGAAHTCLACNLSAAS